jgi:site-specific recombinase XerD
VSPRPAPPPDLAGRWLSKFFAGHLAGERAASPKTISSYRDAIKLLLTWFRDAEQIPPEKLRLADIGRPASCGSWTGWKPGEAARPPAATSAWR